MSILLYCSPVWFSNTTLMRKMERLYYKSLKWCFGAGSYVELLQKSNSLPVCYQIIENDLRLFSSIVGGRTCICFDDHFAVDTPYRPLRSSSTVKLQSRPSAKCITQKFFFRRVINHVNDFHELSSVSLLDSFYSPQREIKKVLSLRLIDSYSLENTCTWNLKCRCMRCTS